MRYPQTPDGRYFVAKNRLWRCSNPALPEDVKRVLMSNLGRARARIKAVRDDPDQLKLTRAAVHAAKVALGERGPVWWDDQEQDQTGKAPQNSTYRDWWADYLQQCGDTS